MRKWTDEHGEDGLRDKFAVYKSADVTSSGRANYDAYHQAARVGADGEFVFVLRPETDWAAFYALTPYAAEVRERAPQLAYDIDIHLLRIDHENRDD